MADRQLLAIGTECELRDFAIANRDRRHNVARQIPDFQFSGLARKSQQLAVRVEGDLLVWLPERPLADQRAIELEESIMLIVGGRRGHQIANRTGCQAPNFAAELLQLARLARLVLRRGADESGSFSRRPTVGCRWPRPSS